MREAENFKGPRTYKFSGQKFKIASTGQQARSKGTGSCEHCSQIPKFVLFANTTFDLY